MLMLREFSEKLSYACFFHKNALFKHDFWMAIILSKCANPLSQSSLSRGSDMVYKTLKSLTALIFYIRKLVRKKNIFETIQSKSLFKTLENTAKSIMSQGNLKEYPNYY